MINLDFCILKNPLNNNETPIVFVTRNGREQLDATIIDDDEYEKAIFALQNFGYIESDFLTFQFSQDPDFPIIEQEKIKEILQEQGMSYNEELEKNLIDEFNQQLKIKDTQDLIKILNERKENQQSVVLTNYLLNNTSIYKVPEVGEKISLYFNLFLECKFKENSCYLNFNGDFFSNEESSTRNFIQILKCDFIRLNNPYNPNKITLKSCWTNEDILKKIHMSKNGSFTKKEGQIGKVFAYHLMEVKHSIPKTNRITVEIDNLSNFDSMVLISKQIKTKFKIQNLRTRKKEGVFKILNDCKVILESKMMKYADMDEFEKAQMIKNDISYIDVKLPLLEKEPENIANSVLEKKYNIN